MFVYTMLSIVEWIFVSILRYIYVQRRRWNGDCLYLRFFFFFCFPPLLQLRAFVCFYLRPKSSNRVVFIIARSTRPRTIYIHIVLYWINSRLSPVSFLTYIYIIYRWYTYEGKMAFSDFSRITRDVLYIVYNIIHVFAAVVIQFYDSRPISKLTNLPRSLQRVEPIFIR